jgi:long-chain fatty acid transport protein
MRRWTVAAIAAGFLVCAAGMAQAQCGALCLYENGSPDLGRAAAGAGARAQDASTAFWNPAGMTELPGNEVLLGVTASFIELNPELNSGTVTPDPTVRGGGNAGGFSPLLGGYFTAELPHGFHVGLASTVLYGGAANYNSNWTGRSFVTDLSLLSFLIQPSVAYAVTDWLSLGAGPTILYTVYNQRLKATTLPGEPTVKIDNADSWDAGGAFSALIKPFEGTRIGIYYRTEVDADTSGSFQGPLGLNPTLDAQFNFPQGVNVSLFQKINDAWAVLADTGWSDWSRFSHIPIELGPIGQKPSLHWHDTWRIGAGFQFTPSQKWTFQGGFGYDSSPVSAGRLLPIVPYGEQYRFAAGLQFRPRDYLEISASYQFMWLGDLSYDHVPLPPTNNVVLNGDYSPDWAQFGGVSLRVKF